MPCVSIRVTFRLKGCSDADWAGDRDERKSTSSYAFILGGDFVSWCSKKQTCVALSTMEFEYVACAAVVQEAVWLKRFLQCLGITTHSDEVVTLYSDSTVALAYAKDPKYHGKSKHIEIKYHFIRYMVARGEVVMKHISTGSMVANPVATPEPDPTPLVDLNRKPEDARPKPLIKSL